MRLPINANVLAAQKVFLTRVLRTLVSTNVRTLSMEKNKMGILFTKTT